MRRAHGALVGAVALAALVVSTPTSATEYWQDSVNTNGNVSVVTPPGGSCFLYQTAPFDIQCYTTIPASFIDTVPNGVLEGVGGAITGYSAVNGEVQFGAASGGGLAQSVNLTFLSNVLGVGAHAVGQQPTLRAVDIAPSLSIMMLYPATGTSVSSLFYISPKGTNTGTTGLTIWNTDETVPTNFENLEIFAETTPGYFIQSVAGGTGHLRNITIDAGGTGAQMILHASTQAVELGAGDVQLTLSGTQSIVKTAGTLTVGTGDANTVNIKTNGSTRVGVSSTGLITVPGFAGGGNQCAYFDNTGLLSVTGSACGTGSGAGGITQLTGDVTAGPGSGSQAATLVNIPNTTTAAGDIVFTEIAAPGTPTVNKLACWGDSVAGSLTCKDLLNGVTHTTQSYTCGPSTWASAEGNTGGVTCTRPTFTDISGSLACGQLPAFSGDLSSAGGTCSVNVTGVESGAAVRGWTEWTSTTAPANPTGTAVREWASAFGSGLVTVDGSGTNRYMVPNVTCSANNWVSQSLSGTLSCSQPAFSSLTGSATCAQLPALTGQATSSAGSCATKVVGITDGASVAWPISGTFTNGQALITSGGNVTTTNQCNVNATCAASGDLGGTYQGPNVVAMHDGGSVRHPTSGTWANSAILSTDGSGNITTEATATCAQLPAFSVGDVVKSAGSCTTKVISVTDLASVQWSVGTWSNNQVLMTSSVGSSIRTVPQSAIFSVPMAYSVRTCNLLNAGEVIQGGITPPPDGSIVEYSPGVAAGTVTLTCYLAANNITSGSYIPKVTRNGFVTTASLTYTSSSTANQVTSSGAVSVSSPSTTDKWGLYFSSVGTANCCNVSTGVCADLTCTILLQP